MSAIRIIILATALIMASFPAQAQAQDMGMVAVQNLNYGFTGEPEYPESIINLDELQVCRVYVMQDKVYVYVDDVNDTCDDYDYRIGYTGTFRGQFYDFGKTAITQDRPVMFTGCDQEDEGRNHYICETFSMMR